MRRQTNLRLDMALVRRQPEVTRRAAIVVCPQAQAVLILRARMTLIGSQLEETSGSITHVPSIEPGHNRPGAGALSGTAPPSVAGRNAPLAESDGRRFTFVAIPRLTSEIGRSLQRTNGWYSRSMQPSSGGALFTNKHPNVRIISAQDSVRESTGVPPSLPVHHIPEFDRAD